MFFLFVKCPPKDYGWHQKHSVTARLSSVAKALVTRIFARQISLSSFPF